MTEPKLKDLLAYHQPLDDQEFKHQLISRIQASERKRRSIVLLFTFIGLFISALYLWSVLSVGVLQSILTPVNGLLLSSIGLFIVWLWTDALTEA